MISHSRHSKPTSRAVSGGTSSLVSSVLKSSVSSQRDAFTRILLIRDNKPEALRLELFHEE